MQIVPSGIETVQSLRPFSLHTAALCWGYITLSAVSSCFYIVLIGPATLNDMWWANYTSTRHQAMLIDIYNALLPTHPAGPFDLLSPRASIAKEYVGFATTTDIYPTYPRRLVMTELTSIEYAVNNLRLLGPQDSVWIGTQYCWVDFNHAFEVAHTQGRQTRCEARYKPNGAVYIESVLRNIDWNDFMTYFGDNDGLFGVSVLNWLRQVPAGEWWIASTATARLATTVADEVAYWHANAITDFTLQWQNDYITGISEVVELENAMGMRQQIVLNNIRMVECTWTSIVMYFAFYNDMMFHQVGNRSIIRSANNSAQQHPVYDIEWLVIGVSDANYNDSVPTFLVRSSIGPYLSIDTWLVAAPPSALDLYRAFQLHVHTLHGTDTDFHHNVLDIVAVTVAPTPRSWTNLVFYGGNPMCFSGTPQPFVQQTFGFYDTCDSPLPLTVDLTPSSAMFASFAMPASVDVDSVCGLVADPAACRATVVAVQAASRYLAPPNGLVRCVVDDLRRDNPGIMQFSTDLHDGNWTMLFQPLVANSSFDFFGWNMVFDWIEGKREVVRFEGDAGSMALVSMPETLVQFPTSTTYVTGATRTIFYMVVYMSFVMVVLGIGCILSTVPSARTSSKCSNFMWFNQIVGSVWIGRPLLALRGCTAVLLLSSTQLELKRAMDTTSSRFTTVSRSWLSIVVIAGETVWLSFVATDCLAIVTRRFTRVFAPWSYAISWVVVIALEAVAPVGPRATIDRICQAQAMDQALNCFSGVVQVGSFTRVCVLIAIQLGSLCAAIIAAKVYQAMRGVKAKQVHVERYMLGVADNFFPLETPATPQQGFAAHDTASWLMVGLVPISKSVLLDVKLWLLSHEFTPLSIQPLTSVPTVELLHGAKQLPQIGNVRAAIHRCKQRLWTALGILNAVGSIIGSISYLQVSKVNFANDLLWATFNMTGTHAYTARWLNEQLALGVTRTFVQMDDATISDDKPYDQANEYVSSAPNVGALLQYTELNTIDATIAGLRTTDACAVPWIFTQYCYVDFGQRWELANTDARQERCKSMASNGAVFLESVLRNVDFAAFQRCWGAAFDVAIANELRQSTDGRNWLSMVSSTGKPSVAVERDYWQAHGVRHFTTQWQNFKTIGLVNEYSVSNVYGIAYPLSLETSFSAFRLDRESTLKFYWALANDFAAVAPFNASDVAGASLVRSSASHRFANTSMESLLLVKGTLVSPLPATFRLVQTALGPFGSIDAFHIPCPHGFKRVVHAIFSTLRQSLWRSVAAQDSYFSIDDGMFLLDPVPQLWADLNFDTVGGSILCPDVGASQVAHGILSLTSLSKQCTSIAMAAMIPFLRKSTVAAAILSQLVVASPQSIDDTCRLVQLDSACPALLNATITFTNTYVAPLLGQRMVDMSTNATAEVASLPIEIFQFGKTDGPISIFRARLLDPLDKSFAFFSWIFLVDWALGFREVVTFAGDVTNITLITEYALTQTQQVNRAQFPVNFAVYLRSAVWYITSTFLFIAVLLLVYVVLCR
ncbi:hypothetical protein DYB32_008411, partial [Aphanomyces invadans]